jgi:FMN-dependent NADH-azoreductase
MNKLLIINAHPEANSTLSFSLNVLDYFLKIYREHQSGEEIIEQINLYEDIVPMVDKTVLHAWRKQRNGEELTTEEQEVTRKMDKVLQQFKSARKYIIAYPMHNFNVPSKLKDYMDNIMIDRQSILNRHRHHLPSGRLADRPL